MSDQKQAWVDIATIPVTIQTAAFTDRALASQLVVYIDGAEEPVLMDYQDVTVPIDKYAEEIKSGKNPFTFIMIDGAVFEVWGYGPADERVNGIDEFQAYMKDNELYWSATLWAPDINLAYRVADELWEELKLKGDFEEYPVAE